MVRPLLNDLLEIPRCRYHSGNLRLHCVHYLLPSESVRRGDPKELGCAGLEPPLLDAQESGVADLPSRVGDALGCLSKGESSRPAALLQEDGEGGRGTAVRHLGALYD